MWDGLAVKSQTETTFLTNSAHVSCNESPSAGAAGSPEADAVVGASRGAAAVARPATIPSLKPRKVRQTAHGPSTMDVLHAHRMDQKRSFSRPGCTGAAMHKQSTITQPYTGKPGRACRYARTCTRTCTRAHETHFFQNRGARWRIIAHHL